MRELNHQNVQEVAGGDFALNVTAHVESNVGWAVTDLFSRIVTGSISDMNQFMTAMNDYVNNGVNFNLVRIENIVFTDFS